MEVISSPVNENISVVITDLTGKIIHQQALLVVKGENMLRVNVRNIAAGTYVLKAVCASGCETSIQKFVKE